MGCSNSINRREFLKRSATCGLAAGGIGLYPQLAQAALMNSGHPLAPKLSHHPAKAQQLIVLFLTGGFAHMDTFDPKPKLKISEGKVVSAEGLRDTGELPLLPSPFKFSACGQSGMQISELFPNLQGIADDLCVIRSLHTDIVEHFQATLAMHTGSSTVPMPGLGAWISHGLGTLNFNLPSYVVLAEQLPYAGAQVWDSGFLPPLHQGVRIIPGDNPVQDLESSAKSMRLAELEEIMLRDVNKAHSLARPDDFNLRARMNTFDTARGMMKEAPHVFDLSRESDATLEQYAFERGDQTSFGWQCLITRRLIERGVRVVELVDTGSSNNWDSHNNTQDHRPKAYRVDQSIAALITDLKQRGHLDQTLIMCCTEFGRTPWAQGKDAKGRNHWAKAFTSLLIGAGVKAGIVYGETDEYGENIIRDPVHVHDYHATILHLLGIDHERLTYRYGGRDFRLTDVAGNVVRGVLS